MDVVKILIVRVSSLGDVVHNMPMVADILRHVPKARIDWVVEEAYAPLVALNSGVSNIIPYALRRWRRTPGAAATRAEMAGFYRALRAQAYDYIFDTQGLFKTGLVMRLARLAPKGKRFGLGNGTEGSGYEAVSRIFHTHSVKVPLRTHAVMRARLVAAAAFAYPVDTPADFLLQAPQQNPAWLPAGPYAAFFHGTARAAKQWPQARWVQLGRMLAGRGLPALLAWGNSEEQATANLLASQIPGAVVLPRLPMMEAVLLAQRAALAVGVDTGLTHIAAAFNRPTIELYCDSPRWKTEGDWSPAIINLGHPGAPPEIAEVESAVLRLLGPAPQSEMDIS